MKKRTFLHAAPASLGLAALAGRSGAAPASSSSALRVGVIGVGHKKYAGGPLAARRLATEWAPGDVVFAPSEPSLFVAALPPATPPSAIAC